MTQVNRREVHDCPFNSNQYSIELHEQLVRVDKHSLSKAAETLAFLVRDAAHITPHNFHTCVHAIRVFVEASVNGGEWPCYCISLCVQRMIAVGYDLVICSMVTVGNILSHRTQHKWCNNKNFLYFSAGDFHLYYRG